MDQLPIISVVTPSFNQGSFIEDTIRSVLSQNYPHVQYLVIDGASSDSTLSILRRYEGRAEIVSEKDSGQVDAILKGFSRARGTILTWLNSDDVYIYKDILGRVADLFRRNPEVSIISGSTALIDSENKFLQVYRAFPRFRIQQLMLYDFIKQPATFFRANVLSEYTLDRTLDCAFDYDFWLRLSKNHRFLMVPDILAGIRRHGDMKTIRLSSKMQSESRRVFDRYQSQISVSAQDRFLAPFLRGINKVAGVGLVARFYLGDADDYAIELRKGGFVRTCIRQVINHKGILF